MKRVLLTGGGTAGHVTPNLALLPALKEKAVSYTHLVIWAWVYTERQKRKKKLKLI